MTEFSQPWSSTTLGDAGPYNDDQWSDMFRRFYSIDRIYEGIMWQQANELEITGAVSPIAVNTGYAIVDGKFYYNDASMNVIVPTPAVATRIDRIVLRKDFTNQTVRVTRIAGTEGTGLPPAIVQIDGTTWDLKLCQASITTGGVVTITDEREFANTPLNLNNFSVQGRLTLTSGSPVMTSEVLAATTVYYTPYVGNIVTLYINGAWRPRIFSELSLDISAFNANTNYDIFLYDVNGVLTLEGTAWSNDTTRVTDIVRQDGKWVKTAQPERLYLGTIRTLAAGECEFSFDTTRPPRMYVWNYYNRVNISQLTYPTAASWTTTSGTTRIWNADSNCAFHFVVGVIEDDAHCGCGLTARTLGYCRIYIRLNGSNVAGVRNQVTTEHMPLTFSYDGKPRLGYNYFELYENAASGNITTISGNLPGNSGGTTMLKG